MYNQSVESDDKARKKGRQIALEDAAYGSTAQNLDDGTYAHAANAALVKNLSRGGTSLGADGFSPGAGNAHRSAADMAEDARRGRAQYGADGSKPGLAPSRDPEQIARDAAALTAFRAGDPNADVKTGGASVAPAGVKPGASVTTPFGTASSTVAKGAGDSGTTVPIMGTENGKTAQIGVKHLDTTDFSAKPDYSLRAGKNGLVPSQDATNELQKTHPEIFVAGSPENQEFVKQWRDQTKGMKAGDQFTKHADIATNAIETATPVDQREAVTSKANLAGPGASNFEDDQRSAGQKAVDAAKAVPGAIGKAVNAVGAPVASAINTGLGFANDVASAVTGKPNALAGVINPAVSGANRIASDLSKPAAYDPSSAVTAAASPVLNAVQGASDAVNASNPLVNAGNAVAKAVPQGLNALQTASDSVNAANPLVPKGPSFADHADIHAQAMKAIVNATSAAHDGVNSSPQYGDHLSPLPPPGPLTPPPTPPNAPGTSDTPYTATGP